MARKMPMSFERWNTDTTRTLPMPKATDSATNARIRVFDECCAFTAVKNWASVLIQQAYHWIKRSELIMRHPIMRSI